MRYNIPFAIACAKISGSYFSATGDLLPSSGTWKGAHMTHALVQDFRRSCPKKPHKYLRHNIPRTDRLKSCSSVCVVCAPFQVPEDGSRFPAAETSKSKYHLFFTQTMANVRNVVSHNQPSFKNFKESII